MLALDELELQKDLWIGIILTTSKIGLQIDKSR